MKPRSQTSSESLKKIHGISLQLRDFFFIFKIYSFLLLLNHKVISENVIRVKNALLYTIYRTKTRVLWNFHRKVSKELRILASFHFASNREKLKYLGRKILGQLSIMIWPQRSPLDCKRLEHYLGLIILRLTLP